MDSLAAKFAEATGEARAAILKEVAAAGEDAKHYLRVMQKVIGGSEAYVEKEYKR
jgi:protein disulfide-isomerase A6